MNTPIEILEPDEPVRLQKFLRFMECDACAAKPGSPTLCAGCLHNRDVISAYNQASLKGDGSFGAMHRATQLGDKGRTKTWLKAREILNRPATR